MTNFKDEIYAFLGPEGAMLGSKSGYSKRNPRHLVIFNANVYALKTTKTKKFFGLLTTKKVEAEKIWWGDIDLTLTHQAVKNLSVEVGHPIVVLYEMDGRFDNEDMPQIQNYVYRANPDGSDHVGPRVASYIYIDEEILELIDFNNVKEEGTIEHESI